MKLGNIKNNSVVDYLLMVVGLVLPWSLMAGVLAISSYTVVYLSRCTKIRIVSSGALKSWFWSVILLLGWYHLYGGKYFIPEPLPDMLALERLIFFGLFLLLPLVLEKQFYNYSRVFFASLLIYCFLTIAWTLWVDKSALVAGRRLIYPFASEYVNSPGFYNAMAISSVAMFYLGVSVAVRFPIYVIIILLSAIGQNRTAVLIVGAWMAIDFMYDFRFAVKSAGRIPRSILWIGAVVFILLMAGLSTDLSYDPYSMMANRFHDEGLESGRFEMVKNSLDVIKSGEFNWGGDYTPRYEGVYYYHNLVLDSFRTGGLIGLALGLGVLIVGLYLAFLAAKQSIRNGIGIIITLSVYLTSIPVEGLPLELISPYYLVCLIIYKYEKRDVVAQR